MPITPMCENHKLQEYSTPNQTPITHDKLLFMEIKLTEQRIHYFALQFLSGKEIPVRTSKADNFAIKEEVNAIIKKRWGHVFKKAGFGSHDLARGGTSVDAIPLGDVCV